MLLLSGWGIVLAAIVLLPHAAARAAFLLTGVAVELAGLVLLLRSEQTARRVSH